MNSNMFPQPNSPNFGYRSSPYSNYLTNKIIVNNIEEVKQYPVPPGGDYIFSHNTEPILFRKTVDAYGQFKISAFNISEVPEEQTLQYVSVKDFESFKAELQEAIKQLVAKSEVTDESSK